MKTVLDLRVLKLQTTQTADSPHKLLILQFAFELTTVKYPYQDNCSLQKPYWESIFVFNNIAILGVWKILPSVCFPQLFCFKRIEFTLTEDSLHRKMTGLNEKSALYFSLNNSKTRVVYSLHGIDYSCKAKPCETKRWVNILHVAESFVQWEGFTCRVQCFLVSADMEQ